MRTQRVYFLSSIVFGAALLLFNGLNTHAATQTANTTVNGVVSSIISVSAGTLNNINVTPGGATATGSHTVSVTTNNSTGYNLTILAAAPALSNGANTIAASGSTPAALADNTWGYNTSGGATYVGVTTTGVQIATANAPASAAATTVYYGIDAASTLPSGTYSTTVTYTAVTK